MAELDNTQIRDVAFARRLDGNSPLDLIERSELFERLGNRYFLSAQRPEFFLAALIRSGRGSHVVDFEDIDLVPGRLVLVRPGQVQLWDTTTPVQATLVLAQPEIVPPRSWTTADSAYRDLGPASLPTASDLIANIKRDRVLPPTQQSAELQTHLFLALLAIFEREEAPSTGTSPPPAYTAFRAALEEHFTQTRSVRSIVADLGYSERTVNRACHQVTGRSAKTLFDERLLLEAKRILAHTDAPASSIAHQIGFSEATNFHKFFVRKTGQSPADFRTDLRSSGYAVGASSPT